MSKIDDAANKVKDATDKAAQVTKDAAERVGDKVKGVGADNIKQQAKQLLVRFQSAESSARIPAVCLLRR